MDGANESLQESGDSNLGQYLHLIDQWADEVLGEIPEDFFGKMITVPGISINVRHRVSEISAYGLVELTDLGKQQDYYSVYEEREKYKKSLLEEVKNAKERGDLIEIKDGDKVIGMTLVTPFKIAEPNNLGISGTACFPMRAIIDQSNRGQGKMTILRTKAINHIKEKYGNIPIITMTNKGAIQHLCEIGGWQEIPLIDMMTINADYPIKQEEAIEYSKKMKQDGYKAYILRPY